MYCIAAAHTVENVVKKSRFIGVLAPCADETEASGFLKGLHARFADASHIVYAYRLKTPNGVVYRFHDAGEPAGTAGKPIFQQLEGRRLVNGCLAVVRYFGGVKLGAGGLARAYADTARRVIEGARTEPYVEWTQTSLTLDYNRIQNLEYLLPQLNGRIIRSDFSERVRVVVELPAEQAAALRAAFGARPP